MIRLTRPFFLLAGLLLSVTAGADPCANGGSPYPVQDGSGSGGTGYQVSSDRALSLNEGSGIGGTGHAQNQDGRGTGGTGHGDGSGMGGTGHGDGNGSGGTGIEGFITGFGSVCVNGLEVEYKESALPPGLDHLAVGQRVQIDAIGHGNMLLAREIRVKYVVVGPVQHVNPSTGHIQVLGQNVKLATASAGNLAIGNRVKISGLSTGPGNMIAYQVEPAGQTPDTLTGTVESISGKQAKVAGVNVILSGSQRLLVGQEVNLQGNFSNGHLDVANVKPEGIAGFAGGVTRVVLQDTVRSINGNTIRLGPDVMRIDSATRVEGGELRPGQLLRVNASVEARGVVRAERIVIESREFRDWTPRTIQVGPADTRHVEDGLHGQDKENYSGETTSEHGTNGPSGSEQNHEVSGNDSGSGHERTESSRDSGSQRDTVDRTEKVERVDKVERVELPEKVERPEHQEHSERPEHD